jgi:alkyl hydroperoxide reductase subunit AhpC
MAAHVQQPAPAFQAKAVIGSEVRDIALSDYRGQHVYLFFYPLDFTLVCPTEIIAFSERSEEFKRRGVQLLGVSVDSHYSHLAWKNTPRTQGGLGEISYPLVADFNKQMSRDYGVLLEQEGFSLRGSFLIDKEGIIRHITINPPLIGRSVDEALRVIDAVQFFEKHGEACPSDWKPGVPSIKLGPKK